MGYALALGLYLAGIPLGLKIAIRQRDREILLAKARLGKPRSRITYAVGIPLMGLLWFVGGALAWLWVANHLFAGRAKAGS